MEDGRPRPSSDALCHTHEDARPSFCFYMRATKFEFEQRFWIIGALIFVAFSLGAIDHVNFAVGLLHWIAPAIDPDSARGNFWLRFIFAGGALLILKSAALRTWATAYLRTEVVHDVSQHSESLVADGPYRYVRNPLYLANLPMMAGIGVMASRLGWLFLVVSMLIFVYRLILREEDGLKQTQGDSYRAYLKAVPRLWPSLSPKVPSGGGQAHWGQAIAGEMIFWLFGVAILCFAITLNIKLTGIVFAVGFAFYFLVVVPLVKKRRTAAGI
jgi:protein-S-isoprenylcysteine O-methyltransferase Ste14